MKVQILPDIIPAIAGDAAAQGDAAGELGVSALVDILTEVNRILEGAFARLPAAHVQAAVMVASEVVDYAALERRAGDAGVGVADAILFQLRLGQDIEVSEP